MYRDRKKEWRHKGIKKEKEDDRTGECKGKMQS
jgi:hypothetical protein